MSEYSKTDERRRFSRVDFYTSGVLLQDGKHWPVDILDISLKGILMVEPAGWHGDPNRPFAVTIGLDNDANRISMSLTLAHREGGRLGFHCQELDLESATHLKSLLIQNSGNPALINRQLSALIKS